MGILETLKKRAQELRDNHEQDSDRPLDLEAYNRAAVVASLRRVHDFLHDMVEQLYLLERDISVDYLLLGVGELPGLSQGGYELYSKTRGEMEVGLCYSLTSDEEYRFEFDDGDMLRGLEEDLRSCGLSPGVEAAAEEKSGAGVLTIKGEVPLSLVFRENFEDASVDLAITNYMGPGRSGYRLKPDQINEAFLEELGKFVLRMDNRMLDLISASVAPARAARGNGGDEEDTDLSQTREISTSRIMSLFNRELHLYLAYNENIKEISSRSPDFVFGRSGECDLVVNSEFASRKHARILFRKGKFVLIDHSTNGTFVKPQGGKEVYVQQEEVPLAGSGFISLGKSASVSNAHMIYYNVQ